MISKYGVLSVDLSANKARLEQLDGETLSRWVGGRGLAAYLMLRDKLYLAPPLSPQSPLILATGPLAATKVPAASRAFAVFRSPLTGLVGGSSVGGSLGRAMARLGLLAVKVIGTAPEPSVLVVDSSGARVEAAGDIWGLRTSETEARLKERYGRTSSTVVIGPAGENLVRFASAVHSGSRVFARGGLGAVMGSKRLKAIVFRAPLGPEPGLEAEAASLSKALLADATASAYRRSGTLRIVNIADDNDYLPSRYWTSTGLGDMKGLRLEGFLASGSVRGRDSCLGCPIACHFVVRGSDGRTSEPEFNSTYALGSLIGVGDPAEVAALVAEANDLGLDAIEAGNAVGLVMRLRAEGRLREGPEFGDYDGARALLNDIAYRRGLGAMLADGVAEAARRLRAEDVAVHVRGMSPPAYDPRAIWPLALSYLVSYRGADHLGPMVYSSDLVSAGVPLKSLGQEVVRLLIDREDMSALLDSAPLCKFARGSATYRLLAKLLSSATGAKFTEKGLVESAKLIVAAFRLMNWELGDRPSASEIPKALRLPIRGSKGLHELPLDRLEEALRLYLEARRAEAEKLAHVL